MKKINILAIDTSGKISTVAILSNDKLLGELNIAVNTKHSQTIMPAIITLLEACGLDKQNLELISCVIGPGSFTGLRIGASVAKGLAFALGLQIVPISALDALAYNAQQEGGLTVPIMDARRGQVYTAIYNQNFEYILPPTVCEIEELLSRLQSSALFLGDGVEVYGDYVLAEGHKIAKPQHLLQRAASSGFLAYKNQHKAINPKELQLTYIRQSQAEREKTPEQTKRHNND